PVGWLQSRRNRRTDPPAGGRRACRISRDDLERERGRKDRTPGRGGRVGWTCHVNYRSLSWHEPASRPNSPALTRPVVEILSYGRVAPSGLSGGAVFARRRPAIRP